MGGNNRSGVVLGLSAMAALAAAWIMAATAWAQPGPPPPPPPPDQPPAQQGTPAGGQPGASGEARRVRWSQQVRLPKDVVVTKDIEYARAGDLPVSFELAMARKDMRLALDTAGAAAPLIVLPALAAAMDRALAAGHAQDDVSVFTRNRREASPGG